MTELESTPEEITVDGWIINRPHFDESNHPNRPLIIGRSAFQLGSRKRYTEMAIEAWKENRYNTAEEVKAYSVSFFETELALINKELKILSKNISQ